MSIVFIYKCRECGRFWGYELDEPTYKCDKCGSNLSDLVSSVMTKAVLLAIANGDKTEVEEIVRDLKGEL